MVEIACPRCSSSEADQVGSDVFVCTHGQTRFIVDHGRARLPDGHATPSAAKSGSKGALIALAGGGLLVITLAVALVVLKSSDSGEPASRTQTVQIDGAHGAKAPASSPSHPAPTPPPAPSVVAAPPPPTATLEVTMPGKTSIGGHFWLATYKNTGETPIGRPAIAVSLFDSSGARVGEERGYARRDYLRPGESTTVLALSSKPPTYERAELTVVEPKAPSYTPAPIDLQVRENSVNNRGHGRSDVVGTIENHTETAVTFARILVVGRNEAGEPVSFGESFATTKDLDPGETSGFKVSLGTWVIDDPKTIEVVAFGRPGR